MDTAYSEASNYSCDVRVVDILRCPTAVVQMVVNLNTVFHVQLMESSLLL